MYVIQLNGEQHYVQATSAVLSTPSGGNATTTIALNQADLPANTYIQQAHLEPQQIQTIQPQTTVIHQQTDSFQDVIDYVQNLYSELSREKQLSTYFCLFCSQEFVDLRLLIRHTSSAHRTGILDGSTNLDQDFEALVRKKIELKEQQHAANQQLYQCVQCQQMFNSLDVISEHLNHCQVETTTANVMQHQNVVETVETVTYQPKIEPPEAKLPRDNYIPYGCAQCGRRYFSIRELMDHLPTCTEETFYDAANYLHQKNWVGAPKDQHIVINEETTNCILKTSGLWLMPETEGQVGSLDLNRGFWVMPSSTSDFLAEQRQQQQAEEEKLRLQQEQQRLLQEQQEKLRIQVEQKRLREEQEKREREEQLMLQRQLIEQQEKLRVQQQIQEHQKQIMLQQQIHRQNHSVVQTISSVPNTVPIVKSSPTPVISHQNLHGRHETTANTIIVLNDEYLSPSASEALKCIQASDGSYHVIGNMDLGERQSSNTTSVIAHTSPTTMQNQTQSRKKRGNAGGRGAAATVAKQNNTTITYTQPGAGNNQHIVTLENVYQPNGVLSMTSTPAKQTNAKRKRATQTITTMDSTPIHVDSQHVQTIETVTEVPQQQFYIAYNDNGVLVPIDAPSTSTAILGEHTTQQSVEVVNLSHDQYIIEDLDASRKAQQKNRKKPSTSAARTQTLTQLQSQSQLQTQVIETIIQPSTSHAPSTSQMHGLPEIQTVDSHVNIPGYDIDDLSHLDQPIGADDGTQATPIKPLKTKPQFVDSFFSFLMNREQNKL